MVVYKTNPELFIDKSNSFKSPGTPAKTVYRGKRCAKRAV